MTHPTGNVDFMLLWLNRRMFRIWNNRLRKTTFPSKEWWGKP